MAGRWHAPVACGLLVLLALQLLAAVRANSVTFDEPNHITRGTAILTLRDWRLSVGHPPLPNILSALPVVLSGVPALPSNPQAWKDEAVTPLAHEWFWRVLPNPQRSVVLGRLPTAAVAFLLAVLVWTWSSRLYGRGAGLLALAVCVLEPNLVAHGALATTDMALAAATALAFHRLWRLGQSPTWSNVALCGVTFGLLQLSKFSAVLLVVPYAILFVAACVRGTGDAGSRWRALLKSVTQRGVVIAVVAGLTIWAGYGFTSGRALPPGVRHTLIERLVPRAEMQAVLVSVLERTPVPARQYLTGLRGLVTHQEQGHASFLLGESSKHGWWYYFLVAIALKTTIPLLVLLGWASLQAVRRPVRGEVFVVVPALFIVASTFVAHINIGLRHVLPAYPLFVVFASRVAADDRSWRMPTLQRGLLVAVLAWQAWEAALVYRQPLAYFNEFAGGPAGGYRYLVDSNVDWGQDLLRLRTEMQRRGITHVKLSYFGSAAPERYGIDYEPLPGVGAEPYLDLVPPERAPDACRPTTGWIAVSVTCLQNLGGYRPGLSLDWLQQHVPVGRAGYSILLYRIDTEEPAACAVAPAAKPSQRARGGPPSSRPLTTGVS